MENSQKYNDEKKHIFETVVNTIEQEYFFEGDELIKWHSMKTKYYELCMNSSSKKNLCHYLDEYLRIFKDPHTRVTIKPDRDQLRFFTNLVWEGEILYYIDNKTLEKRKIQSINGVSVENIYNDYNDLYSDFPIGAIRNEIIKDISGRENNFSHLDELKIIFRDGNELSTKCITFEKFIKQQQISVNDIMNCKKSFMINELSKSTLFIKILTFNDKAIVDQLIENLTSLPELRNYEEIIFDLRQHNGGLIEVAKKVTGLFLRESIELDYWVKRNIAGKLLLDKIKIESNNKFDLSVKKFYFIVDQFTMSSSEHIFLRGISLAHNVIVLGEKTMGLSGQAKYKIIDDDFIMQYTVKKYVDDRGEKIGSITPDVLFEHDFGKEVSDFLSRFKEISDEQKNIQKKNFIEYYDFNNRI